MNTDLESGIARHRKGKIKYQIRNLPRMNPDRHGSGKTYTETRRKSKEGKLLRNFVAPQLEDGRAEILLNLPLPVILLR
jgi:hypothetical protein